MTWLAESFNNIQLGLRTPTREIQRILREFSAAEVEAPGHSVEQHLFFPKQSQSNTENKT